MPLGTNAVSVASTGDSHRPLTRVQPVSPVVYATTSAGTVPAYQHELRRDGNAALNTRAVPVTPSQGVPVTTPTHRAAPRSVTAINNSSSRADRAAFRDGPLTHLQGRGAVAATLQAPPHGEGHYARWGATVEQNDINNGNGSGSRIGRNVASSDAARLQDCFVTPISVGVLAAGGPRAFSPPYTTLGSAVGAEAAAVAPQVPATRAMGGSVLAPSPSATPTSAPSASFQHRAKHHPMSPSIFESMNNRSSRAPDFILPYPFPTTAMQPQQDEKDGGVPSNEMHSSVMTLGGGVVPPSHHADPYAAVPFVDCQQMPQPSVFPLASRTVTNAVSAYPLNPLHAGVFPIGGRSLNLHNSGILPPPPHPLFQESPFSSSQQQEQQQPLQQQPPPQQQQPSRTFVREAVVVQAQDPLSDHPPVRRMQQRDDGTFCEIFERLAYRPSGQHRRSSTSTGLLQRGEQGRVGWNPPTRGWIRHSRRPGESTRHAPPYAVFRPRPGTPPPPHMLMRETHTSRSPLRFSGSHRVPHLSEGYLFEAALAPDVDNMSYEELLELADRIGRVERGVPRERLQQLRVVMQPIHFGVKPTSKEATETTRECVSPKKESQRGLLKQEGMSLTCCICLESFVVGHLATQLPCCSHFLHEGCGSRWFESNFRCPICTRDVRETEH